MSTKAFADQALPCRVTTWTISGKNLEFCYDSELVGYFSKNCFTTKCDAQKMKIRALTLEISPAEKNVNQNPGSVFCKKLSGEVVIGHNSRGSEIAFCKASDGTLVDLVSLQSKK